MTRTFEFTSSDRLNGAREVLDASNVEYKVRRYWVVEIQDSDDKEYTENSQSSGLSKPGTKTRDVARAAVSHPREWFNSKELVDSTEYEDYSRLSSVLSDLVRRGVAEKKACDRGDCIKEYRIKDEYWEELTDESG